ATARIPAERRARLEQARDLDTRREEPAQARGDQRVGPAVAEGGGRGRRRRSDAARGRHHAARAADDPRQPHVRGVLGRRHRDHRLHRSARHGAGRPPAVVAAVPRLAPYGGGGAPPGGDRPYLICTDEARARQKYWDAQFMWVVDIRKETNPIPVATFFPEREKYFDRPGRFGAHNILEDIRSEGPWANLVFLTYFNAGLRAVDVSDPLRPKEVGCYVPELSGERQAVQSNDIGSDRNGLLYLIDR